MIGTPPSTSGSTARKTRFRAASRAIAGDAVAGDARVPRRRVVAGLMLTDAAMLVVAMAVAALGADLRERQFGDVEWAVVFVGLTLALAYGRHLYQFRLGTSPLDDLGHIISLTALATVLLLAVRVVIQDNPSAAGETARLWAFGTVYLGAGRAGLALARRRRAATGEVAINALVVGAGFIGQRVARHLRERPELGLAPVGFLDSDPREPMEGPAGELPLLGGVDDLEAAILEHDVRYAIVAFSSAGHDEMLDLLRRCRALGVGTLVVPRFFEEVTNRSTIEHLGGIALLRVEQVDPLGWQFALKYASDRVVSAVALVVLSPLLAVIALAVRLSSPGPVLYRQRRLGLDGREFELLKFRTMLSSPEAEGEADARWAAAVSGHDVAETQGPDRTTRVGRWLRSTSLDELPQFVNVVRGDMSLIGPRPERTSYVRSFEQHVYRYGDRHRVKSGLTGWAQVQGLRGETSLQDRIEWDNYYIENWSPWLDLKILFLTIPAAFGRKATRAPG